MEKIRQKFWFIYIYIYIERERERERERDYYFLYYIVKHISNASEEVLMIYLYIYIERDILLFSILYYKTYIKCIRRGVNDISIYIERYIYYYFLYCIIKHISNASEEVLMK